MFATMVFLFGAAHADTLNVSLEYQGTTASWTVEDARQGRVLSETLDMEARRHLEITLDYEVLDQDRLRYTAELVDVHKSWLGRERRTVLGRPRITTRPGTPAVLTQGDKVAAPGTEYTHEFRLTVTPQVSG